jgi:hypothetical protein
VVVADAVALLDIGLRSGDRVVTVVEEEYDCRSVVVLGDGKAGESQPGDGAKAGEAGADSVRTELADEERLWTVGRVARWRRLRDAGLRDLLAMADAVNML